MKTDTPHLAPTAPAPDRSPPPERIGALRRVRPLGRGGMGEVWLYRDEALGVDRAVKFLLPDDANDAVRRARFVSEARLLAELPADAPGLVRVHSAGTDPASGRPFFVMDAHLLSPDEIRRVCTERLGLPPAAADRLAHGTETASAASAPGLPRPFTLQDALGDETSGTARQLPEGAVLGLAREIVRALAFLHGRTPPVVHRDLKPANLLFTPDGRLVLADFGIAKALDPARTRLTLPGSPPGTQRYAAPELLDGASATPAADWFALGVVLFRALTSSFPQWGEDFPTREGLRPFSRRWEPLLRALLERDPARRLTNEAAFKRRLDRIERSMAIFRSPRERIARFAEIAAGLLLVLSLVLRLACDRPDPNAVLRPAPVPAPTTRPAPEPTSRPAPTITTRAAPSTTTRPAPTTTTRPAPVLDQIKPLPGEDEDRFVTRRWIAVNLPSVIENIDCATSGVARPIITSDGVIRLRYGEVATTEDILDAPGARRIVLDGGELRFAPPLDEFVDARDSLASLATRIASRELSETELRDPTALFREERLFGGDGLRPFPLPVEIGPGGGRITGRANIGHYRFEGVLSGPVLASPDGAGTTVATDVRFTAAGFAGAPPLCGNYSVWDETDIGKKATRGIRPLYEHHGSHLGSWLHPSRASQQALGPSLETFLSNGFAASAERFEEILSRALPPVPDDDGDLVVPSGRILLVADVPDDGSVRRIVLRGGELVFAPSSARMRDIVQKNREHVGPDDIRDLLALVPVQTLSLPVLVGAEGGTIRRDRPIGNERRTALWFHEQIEEARVLSPVSHEFGESPTLRLDGGVLLDKATFDRNLRVETGWESLHDTWSGHVERAEQGSRTFRLCDFSGPFPSRRKIPPPVPETETKAAPHSP